MTTTNHAFLAKKIAIIGAGISGLSCASQLVQQGHSVTIFDKSKGVGGRMSTKRLPLGDCDHGAQYFTCNHPEFAKQIQAWLDAKVIAIWNTHPVVLGGFPNKLPTRTNLNINSASLEGSASDLAAPLKNTIRYVGIPSMTAPAKFLSQQLKDQQVKLLTSHTVSKITKTNQQWLVTSQEQQDHSELFDAIVIAIPAEQARALVEPFHPSILSTVCSTPMTACFALIAQFNTSIPLNFEAAFVNQGPLSWICLNNHKPGRSGSDTWLLHASADWSEQHLEADPLWVKEKMLEAFNSWAHLKLSSQFTLPDVVTTLHRWKYANLKNPDPIENGFIWQEELQIGLCGDWLNGGKVQGAWLSGFELAQTITQFNENNNAL